MMKEKVSIMGLPFTNTTMKDMLEQLKAHLLREEKAFIVTANPEIVMYAKENKDYEKLLEKATYITADGIGVVKAAKVLNQPLPERVTGFDMLKGLLAIANEQKLSVYLLGAKPEVLDQAVENVKKEYPHLNIVGSHHGYFDQSNQEIAKEVKELQPDLVFVALGFPRQEQWIADIYDDAHKGLFMGVGGSFDVLAGAVQRAPEVWQKLNVEWLYRLMKQPSRWKRMLVLPQFMLKIWQQKLIGKRP